MSPAAVRWWPAVRASVRRDPDEPTAQYGSSPDSPLEGTGFEPSVPPFRSGVPAPTAGAVRRGLFAGGRWIRTSSTGAPVNRVIPLLCCPIAWDELARARVLLGSYDLTREEIWVNLIDRDRPHGLKEPARSRRCERRRGVAPRSGCRRACLRSLASARLRQALRGLRSGY